MTSPGGKKVLLFQSPNTSAGDVDPFPPSALLNTDTVQKAEQYRSSSASEDRWTVPCEHLRVKFRVCMDSAAYHYVCAI